MKRNLPENYLNSVLKNEIGRNDLGHNPEVLFQSLAFERSIIKSLYKIEDFSSMKVLDVGCGDGGSLLNLVRLGFEPSNLTGIDILPDRISKSKNNFPNINFLESDASNLPFPDTWFDLVMESTMFIQLTNEDLCESIASEMIRTTKINGYIMLIDWRYSKPWNDQYVGLSKKRLTKLFKLENSMRVISIKNGALIPFIGRFISSHCPAFYFMLQAMFPFMVGQVTYLIQKVK